MSLNEWDRTLKEDLGSISFMFRMNLLGSVKPIRHSARQSLQLHSPTFAIAYSDDDDARDSFQS